MLQLDALLEKIGGFGKCQILVFVLLSYYNLSFGFNAIGPVFLTYTPTARCKLPKFQNWTHLGGPNVTEADILNWTTPYNEEKKQYDGCYRYDYNYDKCVDYLSCVNKSAPLVPCRNGYHYDRSIFEETVVSEFNLVCERKILGTVSTAIYMIGVMIGSIVFGNISDRIGRQRTMVFTFSFTLACMFGVSYSTSVALFILFRFGTAVFAFGTTISAFVYIIEVSGKNWRTLLGIGHWMTFALGYMILSGIAYYWRDWHDIQFVCSLISFPFLVFALLLPESPRWLFAKERNEEGKKITLRMAKINGVVLVPDDWSHADMKPTPRERHGIYKQYTTLDLFRPPRMRLITFKVMFNWFVNSFVYYGISLNAGALAGDLFVNNTLGGVMEIGGYAFCILLMDRVGRRILLSFMMFVAGLGLIGSVIVNEYAGENQGLITFGLVLAFAAKVGISGSFAVIYNLTSELYPTVVRSNSVGLGSTMARVGSVLAPFVITLQDRISWLPNAIFGVAGIIAAILSLTFPETSGQDMLETMDQAEHFYKTGEMRSVECRERYATLSIAYRTLDGGRTNEAYNAEDVATRL